MTAREKREFLLHDVWLVLAVTALFICLVLSIKRYEWVLSTMVCGAVFLAIIFTVNFIRIGASARRFSKRVLLQQ